MGMKWHLLLLEGLLGGLWGSAGKRCLPLLFSAESFWARSSKGITRVLNNLSFKYSVVQLNFTPEIEVFFILFERCLSIFSMTTLNQRAYFNFRGKIQLEQPANALPLCQSQNYFGQFLGSRTSLFVHLCTNQLSCFWFPCFWGRLPSCCIFFYSDRFWDMFYNFGKFMHHSQNFNKDPPSLFGSTLLAPLVSPASRGPLHYHAAVKLKEGEGGE